jgi:hypothetical protein
MLREGSNGFNADQLSKYLATIDSADDELASLLGSYRASCKGPRERIKNAKGMAKEAGINMTAFNEYVAAHRAKRRQDKRLADLEPEDLDDYNAMVEALGEFGDTPLGAAALAKAKPRGEDALDGLGDDTSAAPAERADAEHLAELGRG